MVQDFNSPGRQMQVDLSEFRASLVYNMNSRTARDVSQTNPVSKKPEKEKKSVILRS